MSFSGIIKSKKHDLFNSCRIFRQFVTSTTLIKNKVPPPINGFLGAAAKRSTLSVSLPSRLNPQRTPISGFLGAVAKRSTLNVSLPSRLNPQRMFSCPPPPPPPLTRTEGFTLILLGASVFFYWSAERIPYTNRFHFPVSFWEHSFVKDPELLPPTDPASIRVDAIARDIIQALHSGLRLDPLDYQLTVNGNSLYLDAPACCCHNKLWWKPRTKHLSRKKDWQVTVTDSDFKCSSCSTRTIPIPKKSLDGLTSDAEIATVIAHAVGHAVARHSAELWKICLLSIGFVGFFFFCLPLMMLLSVLNIIDDDWDGEGIVFFVDTLMRIYNHFDLRNEREADYIGLMLMASAGYDPREAPKVYKKILTSPREGGHDIHPFGIKRTEFLNKPKVMKKAVAIYNQVKAGSGARSFI